MGYVLLRAKQIDKAILVFKVNKAIFPYNLNTIDSYADALHKKKNYNEALKNYHTILAIEPKNENALSMVTKINTLIDKKSQ